MRPWALVHRGRVTAEALWFDTGLLGEDEARRRVLQSYQPGDRVQRVDGGLALRFARPRRVDAALGVPWIRMGDVLVAAPLRELERVGLPGPVIAVRGGTARSVRPRDEDVAAWFDIGCPVGEVEALPPPPTKVVGVAAVEVGRADFGIGEPAAEADALMAAMEGVELEPDEAPPAGLFDGLKAFFGFGKSARESAAARQERMLDALIASFDGDLDEALRRAVPLGGTASGTSRVRDLATQLPDRERLRPSALTGRSNRTFEAGGGRYEVLRERYRRTAEALVAQGEIEKAAFVHADLLGDVEAAVQLLESHERFELAAQLCEGRLRAPPRAVRLHLLAGNVRRALQIAHRFECFAAALAQIRDPSSKRALRAAWAATLASAGRHEAAIEVVWSEEGLRRAAIPWLKTVVERRGREAPRALLRWERLASGAGEGTFARWCRDDVALRAGLLEASTKVAMPERWQRRLARRSMVDAASDRRTQRALGSFLGRPELADLRVDRPVFPKLKTDPPGEECVPLEIAGGVAILDVFQTPWGVLCARGEAGVVLVSPTGRVLWRDGTPVSCFAGGDEGPIIGIHPTGTGVSRLSRIDVASRVVSLWVRTRLQAFDRVTPAGRWFVVDDRIRAIDLHDEGWVSLLDGPRVNEPVHGIGAGRGQVRVVVGADELAVVQLTTRLDGAGSRTALAGMRQCFAVSDTNIAGAPSSLRHAVLYRGTQREVVEAPVQAGPIVVMGWWQGHPVIGRELEEGVQLAFRGAKRGMLRCVGASAVGLRVQGDVLWVYDDLGRLVRVGREVPSVWFGVT